MAVNTNYVTAMSNGVCSVAPKATPAPTGMTALTTPWVDAGSITTDGLTENLSESRTDFKRWGNITPFKSVVTDRKHEFDLAFLEPNATVLGLYYPTGGAAIAPDATSHIITITDDTSGLRDIRSFVFDLTDGTNHFRFYIPNGEVTARKNPVYKTDAITEYGVTITAYPTSAGVAVVRTMLLDAVVAGG